MSKHSHDPLRFVENPTLAECAAFIEAYERLSIEQRLNLLASDPLGFERMAVHPDGSHVQIALAFATIAGEPGKDGMSHLTPELRGALRRMSGQ